MYEKDFDNWNLLKKDKEFFANRPYFRDRDIFFAHIGVNIGFEQDGKGSEFLRPVLILKKFNKYSAFIIPLSTKQKVGKFYYSFVSSDGIDTIALLSQSRLIDVKRLKFKKGMIAKSDFILIKKKLGKLLEIF